VFVIRGNDDRQYDRLGRRLFQPCKHHWFLIDP
jgi:hypothetical protein